MLSLFNINRSQRLIELSNVTQGASRMLAENSRCTPQCQCEMCAVQVLQSSDV